MANAVIFILFLSQDWLSDKEEFNFTRFSDINEKKKKKERNLKEKYFISESLCMKLKAKDT